MGFRSNSYMRIWEEVRRDTTNPVPKWVTVRTSISRKNKETGQYDQDFSGYVSLVGAACTEYLNRLQQAPLPFNVKLGDIDCRSYYNKDTKQSRYDFTVFSFAPENQNQQGQYQHPATAPASAPAPAPAPAQQQYNRPQAQQYQQPAQPQYNQPQQTQYQQQPFQQAPAAPAPAGGGDAYSIPEIDEELPFN